MKLSLYTIAAEYRQDIAKLADLDMDDATLADTLEGMGGELQIKATNVAMFARDLETTAESIKEAEAQMAKRRKAIENRAAGLRRYLLTSMQVAQVDKIECPYFKLSIKKNNPAVEVYEPGIVPADYMKQPDPPPATVDKVLVQRAIKDGFDVPGCRLTQGVRLDIS